MKENEFEIHDEKCNTEEYPEEAKAAAEDDFPNLTEKDLYWLEADRLQDPVAAYRGEQPCQGEYTIHDYYALPDDIRVELIDGVFYNMAAPTHLHGILGLQIYAVFDQYIKKKRGKCIPLAAPVDVQLDRDDYTIVQPDVMIVCDRDKLTGQVVYGAPDLVIEVLSPSTSRKDRIIKYEKYRAAGVREYWLVDPVKKQVTVYRFEKQKEETNEERVVPFDVTELPVTYQFTDQIPVGIFDGDCVVDFAEIDAYVSFLY